MVLRAGSTSAPTSVDDASDRIDTSSGTRRPAASSPEMRPRAAWSLSSMTAVIPGSAASSSPAAARPPTGVGAHRATAPPSPRAAVSCRNARSVRVVGPYPRSGPRSRSSTMSPNRRCPRACRWSIPSATVRSKSMSTNGRSCVSAVRPMETNGTSSAASSRMRESSMRTSITMTPSTRRPLTRSDTSSGDVPVGQSTRWYPSSDARVAALMKISRAMRLRRCTSAGNSSATIRVRLLASARATTLLR